MSNLDMTILATDSDIATYRASLSLATPSDYGNAATKVRVEEELALRETAKSIRKSTSLKLGAMIADAREKHRRNSEFSLRDVYKEMGISEKASRKYLSVYERTAGIDDLISVLMRDINQILAQDNEKGAQVFEEITLKDILENEIREASDNEKRTLLHEELFDSICKLHTYSIALNGRPTISSAFDEVEKFKTARDKATGERVYSLLDEARLFSDATEYVKTGKKLKLNELKNYLVKVVATAESIGAEEWTVTLEEVIYEETVEEEEPVTEEPRGNPFKDRSLSDKDKVAKDFVEKINIAGNLDFKDWYMKTYMSYEADIEYIGVHQKSAAVDTLRENIDEWSSHRKQLLSKAHPDRGGSSEEFHIMKAVDDLFKVIGDELAQENNERIKDAYGGIMEELSLDSLKQFNNEWMEDDEG